MSSKLLTAIGMIALLAVAGVVSAATLNVPGDYSTIQSAIAAAVSGDTIQVAAGTYVESGQIVIDKDLSIIGAGADQTVIKPAGDTTGSGDGRGWILVQSGVGLSISYVCLDGQGWTIRDGIRVNGSASVSYCTIRNIRGASYDGFAIDAYGPVNVQGCLIENIERVGIRYYPTGAFGQVVWDGNIYRGKRWGEWLDYAFDIGAQSNVLIQNNLITGCLGIAYDASESCGMQVYSDWPGTPSQATVVVQNNVISGCTGGIIVGTYDATDNTLATATGNDLVRCLQYGLWTGSTVQVAATGNLWQVAGGDPLAWQVVNEGVDLYDVPYIAPTPDVSAPMGAQANSLILDVPATQFVKPGDSIYVEMNQASLASAVTGFQAFIEFDSALMGFVSGSYTDAPFGLWFTSPIDADGANIDLAAGIRWETEPQDPTMTDAKLVDLTFEAGQQDGRAQVFFREADRPTVFTTDQGDPIVPKLFDSQVIVIDGTAPTDVTIAADPAGWTKANAVQLTFSASDALAGVDHYELQVDTGAFFEAESPYNLDVSGLADGEHTVTAKAIDKCGNEATNSTSIYLDKTAPTVTIDSATQDANSLIGTAINAIQGTVTITVSAGDASPSSGLVPPPVVTVTDSLGNPMVVGAASGTGPWTYECTIDAATANGTATIRADIYDAAGNPASQAQATFQVNKTQLTLSVGYENVEIGATRTLKIYVGGSAATGIRLTFTKEVTFTTNPVNVVLADLSNEAAWTRVSVKDEKHTLRKAADVSVDGDKQYSAAVSLVGGDLTNDNWVDILDFGVFSGQYGSKYTSGTVPRPGRDADINGDGSVWSQDFSYISGHFLQPGEAQIGMSTAIITQPKSTVPVAQLALLVGATAAKQADMNGDGRIDSKDIKLFVAKNLGGRR